jgi:hypothetical protein
MAAITPQRKNRARAAVLELVRSHPGITIKEIARELAAVDTPEVLLIAMSDTNLAVIDKGTAERLADPLEDAWGPAPSDTELEHAQRAGEHATRAALTAALEGALSRETAAERIGVTPQAISERLKAGKLVGLRRGREWRFPAWQFAEDGTLPALGELIDVYPGTPLALSTWAVTPSVDLNGHTPAQALARRGGPERVLELAHVLSALAW